MSTDNTKWRLPERREVSIISGGSSPELTETACGIAAHVERGTVFIMCTEDAVDDVESKLRSAGADMGKCVRVISDPRDPYIIPAFLEDLRQLIAEDGDVRLVILDPVTAFMDHTNSREEVFAALQALAAQTDVSVLCTDVSADGRWP